MSGHPAAERVAGALMLAGAALTAASIAVWLLNIMPTLPAWMIQLAIYKLTFVSGAGLVIAGATVRRSLRLKAAKERPPAVTAGDVE